MLPCWKKRLIILNILNKNDEILNEKEIINQSESRLLRISGQLKWLTSKNMVEKMDGDEDKYYSITKFGKEWINK